MRLNLVELAKRHARSFQRPETVPFRQRFHLSLQNRVKGASFKEQGNNCLYEMSLLLACMKANDFENSLCNSEIQKFQKCVEEHTKFLKEQKRLQQIGIPTPDTKHFTDSQIDYLLHKYPNV